MQGRWMDKGVTDVEVFDAIRARRSVRSYSSDQVPKEALERVIEAGRLAPSASNVQPWHFIVVTDQGRRNALSEGRYAGFLKQSPVVIVGCGDRKASPKWYVIDTTIALENMVIQATAEGLGTCWIGSFDNNKVARTLGLPEHMVVVAMLAVGYPKDKLGLEDSIRRKRSVKSASEVVSIEGYGKVPPE
jgi:nitroreductase